MINSMTAFARADKTASTLSVSVEIRSYNSKNLDMVLRMPPGYQPLEEKIKGAVARQVARGRIEIGCQITREAEEAESYVVNMPKARGYYQALTHLKDEFGLAGAVSLDHMATVGNIIRPAEIEQDMAADWLVIEDCLLTALTDLCAMRAIEGANMETDLTGRLETVADRLVRIEEGTDGLLERYRQRLGERIHSLTKGAVEIDPARIAQEAAILADRSDISEEIIRAQSHIQQFRSIMAEDGPAGRKLNFLLQEFNREFNTMGAKAGDASISHMIVEVKSALEKMREQVQNVE